MKVLVTGANGFIGQHVVECLKHSQINYIATDYHFDKERDKQIECDLFDKNLDFYNFFGHPDIILHLAWRDGFVHNSSLHMHDLSSHFDFLNKMINSGVKQIVCMGTMHEIGYYEGKIDENTPCNPLSQYGIAKNALRKSIELLCNENQVIFQWIRAFYIYSNDMKANSIFSKIQKAAIDGQKKFPFTSGQNKYDFITIDELANQIVSIVKQKEITGIINCCSGYAVTLAEKVESFIKKNNLNINLEYGTFPERKYDSKALWGDTVKIRKILKKGNDNV